MSVLTVTKNPMSQEPSNAKKRGRKPLPPEEAAMRRKETLRKSTANRVKKLKSAGKDRMEAYVSPGTKEGIEKLKTALNAETQGDVIDALVAAELKKLNLC